jgi:hypothetical protein
MYVVLGGVASAVSMAVLFLGAGGIGAVLAYPNEIIGRPLGNMETVGVFLTFLVPTLLLQSWLSPRFCRVREAANGEEVSFPQDENDGRI